jgi:class 3 adenylate cyclase/DNA-binding MarR family transcriptional regulator
LKSGSSVTRRRLAAILCADVAGYSRLMRQDEAATFRLLATHREIADRLITDYGGRIANTAGDSILAEFPSAVNALQCSLVIQEKIAAINEWAPQGRRVAFRIGLHVGEVLEQGGDLFGDDVNVAARMQELAGAGSVCLSNGACGYVRKVVPANYEDLGLQRVKNLETPIHAFLVRPSESATARAFPPIHRAEFYLARRFQTICAAGLNAITRPEKLQPIDIAALASLGEAPGIDQARLAERLGVDAARAGRIVARLRGRGLLQIKQDRQRQRHPELRVTAAGQDAMQRLRPAIRSALEKVLAPLSTEEREILKDLLARIVKAHEIGAGGKPRLPARSR